MRSYLFNFDVKATACDWGE